MTPYGYPGLVPPKQTPLLRRVRRPRRRFRWYILWIPLVLLGWSWLSQGVELSVTWDHTLDALGIRDQEGITQMATLGVVICTALAIVRVVRGRRHDP